FTDFDNYGTFNNNFQINNAGNINQFAGTFSNNIPGTIVNQLGSEIRIHAPMTNLGTIDSQGDILVKTGGTLTNENLLFALTNGSIRNAGTFFNNNTIQNFDVVVNETGGDFQNNGTITIQNGQVVNNGDFTNLGRLTNNLEFVNNQNLYNPGTIENGVRIFNYGFFQNTGYLLNIGDFDNEPTGNFYNSGAIDNNDGGIITNYGEFNNDNEIFNNHCSSFVNAASGIINNNHWLTNKSLFWNFGVLNGKPIMNVEGGVVITAPFSTEVCENVTVNLDPTGQTLILGTSIAVNQFDTCGTLNFLVNDLGEMNFTCADKGIHTVTLEITDRKGNSVKCDATVTVVDDQAPIIENCPAEVVVLTSETSAPADWTPPTATDNCDAPTLTSTHNPGDIFPLGTTIVTYTATDTEANASTCQFPVTIVQDGDCADVLSVRKVSSTNDNCGNWCGGAYAFTLGSGQCYEATDDLLFIEYRDGTALLTGTVARGNEKASVYVEFSGFSSTAPADSPKYGLCVQSGGADWTYYQEFTGRVVFSDCQVLDIKRFGPSFQMGKGANLQDPDQMGAAAWFDYGGSHHGDFNFRLSAPVECQRSIYFEAECADHIGARWTTLSDPNASNGKYLSPPGNTSYDYPPVSNDDVVVFNAGVTQAGAYRIYFRSLAADGSSDSYWVRVNGGNWIKWNKVNAPNQGNTYEWDQVGQWDGGARALPQTFNFIAGSNSIEVAWREPNIRLDKVFVTRIGKAPQGTGEPVADCDSGVTPPPTDPCNKNLLFVVGDLNLNAGDAAIKSHLASLGFHLTIVDGWYAETSDADGKGAVIISSTVNSTEVNTKFRDVTVPVITWEGWLMDDMKMTGTQKGSDYGIHADKNIEIAAAGHPVAAGLNGKIKVFADTDDLNYGKPSSNATIIAHVVNDPAWPVLFVYEQGAGMKGMTAPARRAGFFLRDNGASQFTAEGWKLFDATILWAIGDCDDSNVEPPVVCNQTALMVVGSTSLNAGDQAIKSRLESLGFTVTLKDDDYCATSDADGMGLIYISATVSSSKVNSKYKKTPVPVVASEAWIFDDMKMTGTGSGYNYGKAYAGRNIVIEDGNHPIAQGANGELTIFDKDQYVSWGNPGSEAARIGYVPGEPACSMLFAYEKGANMVGFTAPERRVGFFLRNGTAAKMNNTGWRLFDATILWATKCDGSQNLEADFTEILDLDAFRNEREVQLVWKNNTAFKNDLFILEHSTDGQTFEPIVELPAFIEENRSTRIYQDFDPQPATGTNYYRVRVAHLDGTIAVSPVQVVVLEELADFALFPNPADSYTNINLEHLQGQSVSIQIHDLAGHTLRQIKLDQIETLDYRLDVSDLRDGQYLISLYAEGRRPVTKKLYISR
ncbi:MAG: HYR domain-containing protein, partial [Bacteroidetes bacterium]